MTNNLAVLGTNEVTLYGLVAALSIYAWKDWFVSLCGLILIMAVIQHENMPTNMYDVQGLNPWNCLFIATCLGWNSWRCHIGFKWDMPRHITVLLLLCCGVIVVGVLRATFDRSYIRGYPVGSLISEELINTIKWVLPGLLLFTGCRTRKRLIMAVICVLAVYLVLSVQVIDRMPAWSALSGSLSTYRRTKICQEIGYCASDLSAMLAGASWSVLAALPLVRKKRYWVVMLAAAGMVTCGAAMTGGRVGYLAWGATGLVLCLLKWRKYLVLAPVVVLLLPTVFPGATKRMLTGFGEVDVAGQSMIDDESMTSGRTLMWPYVIDKIGESPLIGYGRLAMKRTGVFDRLMSEMGESFPHPHNMYLETLLDNGILGSTPIFLLWGTMIMHSVCLFRSHNRLYSTVGGLALSLMLAQLFAGVGSQHFYPMEGSMCMWMAMFLVARIYVEETQAQMKGAVVEGFWTNRVSEPQVAALHGYK